LSVFVGCYRNRFCVQLQNTQHHFAFSFTSPFCAHVVRQIRFQQIHDK